MASPTPVPAVETSDETTRVNVYDENGYLPIHRAALSGHESILRTILEEAQRRNELEQQLEALTKNDNQLTPLLLATIVGRLEIIACLVQYPVNIYAIDSHGHDIAAIAALSQNERTLRYIVDLSVDYNPWKSLFKLLLSIKDDESIITGRMLELLTRSEANNSTSNSSYWPVMCENGFLASLVELLSFSKNDEVLLNGLVLLFNLISEVPETKAQLKTIKNSFTSILKHVQSTNVELLTLLGRVLSSISEEKSIIEPMFEQNIIGILLKFLSQVRSAMIASAYFDCFSNIVSYSPLYQRRLENDKDFLLLIVNVYLQEFDIGLSLAVIRFIRQLAKNNKEIQNALADYGACEHLLGALAATSKELQHVTIEAIQSLATNNRRVQQIFIGERAIEQLLSLFEKTNLSHLQIAVVCCTWTLCENSLSRRRDVARRIGVRKLISFYTLKSDEHLRAVTEALNELAKSTASVKMNIQEEIQKSQGISYLTRLLKSDDELLVLSVLRTLQLTSCAPGYVPNRINQDLINKNEGIVLIVALMMHAKSEIIQVEAAQALASIALGHPTYSMLIETTLDFSYAHLIELMKSKSIEVQLKASNALATFVYNNARVQHFLHKHCQLTFAYFEKFLQDPDDERRCSAAFQIVALAGLIRERRQSMNTAIGCGILMDILRQSTSDEAKSAAAECLARLAHMKSGVPQALIAVNAIDYLCQLFSSSNETTIGNAAIALGFLSNVPEGRRKLLHKCRNEPDIMNFLKLYNCLPDQPARLSKYLLEDWDRYYTLKLPKIRPSKGIIRYFQASTRDIYRCRPAPPSPPISQTDIASTFVKFYLPPIDQI